MLLVSSSHYFSFYEQTNQAPATTTAATKKKIWFLPSDLWFNSSTSQQRKNSEEYSLIRGAGHLAMHSQFEYYFMPENGRMILLFLEYGLRHTSKATNLLAQHPNAHSYCFEHNSILFHPILASHEFSYIAFFYMFAEETRRKVCLQCVAFHHRRFRDGRCHFSHIFRMPKIRRKTQTYIYIRATRYCVRVQSNKQGKRNINFVPAGWRSCGFSNTAIDKNKI